MSARAAFLALAVAGLGLAGCASDGGDSPDPGAAPDPAAVADGAADATAAGETDTGPEAADPDRAAPEAAAGGIALPPPQPGAPPGPDAGRARVNPEDIRDIYLAFEGSAGSTISIIFAIDGNANGDPTDEPALRLSPEDGACNPQELAGYRFPNGATRVFGLDEAQRGVTPDDLPRYLAASVTEAMLGGGLAETREATLPQNVCTRKLWEVLVANQRARAEAAGQG